MGKKKNKNKKKSVELDNKLIPLEDDQKEETNMKNNKFELIGKIVVGAGVGLLGVGAAVFGIFRGKKKGDPESDQVAEELPADFEEVPEETE